MSTVRPTMTYLVVSTLVMISLSVAISKIGKKERKGVGYGFIVTALVITVVSMMYNFWTYAKETGAGGYMKNQASAMYSKIQAKVGAPVTNVGTTAVVS